MAEESIERRLVGGKWSTVARDESDAAGPTSGSLSVEVVTITAAQVIAAWDVPITTAYVECLSFAVGDTLLGGWFSSTLDDGQVDAIAFAAAGLTSAQVNAEQDTGLAPARLSFAGALTVQVETAVYPFPTLATAACAGYLAVGNAIPATGAVTLYCLVDRV